MIDIKFLRENPDVVKENIKKKFQDKKLPLVDEVIELDEQRRASMAKADELRANRNKLSKEIGALMAQGKKDEAMAIREKVTAQAQELEELGAKEKELNEKVTSIMMSIPNIIEDSVPIGKDDSENVEVERFGEPVVPDYEIPWKALTASTLKPQAELQATVFIILWAISQDFILQLSAMQEIL